MSSTVAFLIVAGLALFVMAVGTPIHIWHHEAIVHHAAHYDAKTGDFKWNDEK